jgi:MipA family protein
MRAPERCAGEAGTPRPNWCSALAVLILITSGIAPATAQADDLTALFEPGTVFSLGALAGAGPRFQGSRRTSPWGLPYFSFRRADEAPEWWSPDDGLDSDLVSAGPLRVGPVLDLRDGRSAKDTRSVPGLPAVPLTVGLGLFGELWFANDALRVRAEVTQGVRARDGILVKLAGDAIGRFGHFTLSGGPRLVLADAASQRIDFGVPERARGLAPYDPKGGLRSAGLAAALAYDWSDSWQTLVYGRYDRLLSEAARSPIVRRFGSVHEMSVGIGAIYSFRSRP